MGISTLKYPHSASKARPVIFMSLIYAVFLQIPLKNCTGQTEHGFANLRSKLQQNL